MYLYIFVLLIAFLSSLKNLRLDILHYKVIRMILGIDLVVEVWSLILVKCHLSNVPLYNFNLLIEFWLYAYYYSLIIDNKKVRKMICLYLWGLPVAWIIMVVLIFHPDNWNSHFFAVGSVSMVLLSAYYYYQLFTAERLVRLSANFEFWVATALIVYYACDLPYLGMLNYLNKNFQTLANQLLAGLQILNIIFYLILSYAFTWATPIKKSS